MRTISISGYRNSLSSHPIFSAVKLLTRFSHSPEPDQSLTRSRLPPSRRRMRDVLLIDGLATSFALVSLPDSAQERSRYRECSRRLTKSTRQGQSGISASDYHYIISVFHRYRRSRRFCRNTRMLRRGVMGSCLRGIVSRCGRSSDIASGQSVLIWKSIPLR